MAGEPTGYFWAWVDEEGEWVVTALGIMELLLTGHIPCEHTLKLSALLSTLFNHDGTMRNKYH